MEAFYPGLHQPSDAQHFDRCCIHVERLVNRQKPLGCDELLLDSQAFMKLRIHGGYPNTPEAYAVKAIRIAGLVRKLTAVTEDWMCEAFMLAITGKTVREHQQLTIERYDAIRAALPPTIDLMPVLQGYRPREYVQHIRDYGDRLGLGQWVGVGSVCKRNTDPSAIKAVLLAIKAERPDLRLHGFGVKLTALQSGQIRTLLHSADSMAWSYAGRAAMRTTGVRRRHSRRRLTIAHCLDHYSRGPHDTYRRSAQLRRRDPLTIYAATEG